MTDYRGGLIGSSGKEVTRLGDQKSGVAAFVAAPGTEIRVKAYHKKGQPHFKVSLYDADSKKSRLIFDDSEAEIRDRMGFAVISPEEEEGIPA